MALLKKHTSEKREKIGHIISGIIILLHAYEKYDDYKSSSIFFLAAGIIFLSVAIWHHKLIHRFHYIDGVFFAIESVLYGFIAAEYFEAGKKALPWCYVFCVIAYLVAAVLMARRGKKRFLEKQSAKQE